MKTKALRYAGLLWRWFAGLPRAVLRPLGVVTLRDIALIGGWLVLATGACMLSLEWGLVAAGLLAFAVGVFGIQPTHGGS